MLDLLVTFSLFALWQEPAATPQKPVADQLLYELRQPLAVGEDGGWDYIVVDGDAHLLYVPRGNRVLVLDAETGKKVREIADTAGVHGVALATELGKGFASNGRANTATVFDLKTGATLSTIKTGKNPDALVFEPKRKRVYIGNGRSDDVTVIDAEKLEVVGTVPIGGKPEAIVCDADGTVFVNVENTSEIVHIDAEKLAVAQRFAVAPGEEPSGLAFDVAHHTLFAVCGNEKMVVVDSRTGKVLATPTIGKRVDGAAFDPECGCAISSNGEGTLSVVTTRGEHPFTVVQTLPTIPSARTITIDPKTRRLYLPAAEYEAAQPAASGGQRRRPAIKPDSFRIVVVAPVTPTTETKK